MSWDHLLLMSSQRWGAAWALTALFHTQHFFFSSSRVHPELRDRHPHSQVQCVNKPLKLVGVDRSRLVTEKARGTAFQGYLDLSGEHAECLSTCNSATEEPVAILVLEMDNVFSFFMEKACFIDQNWV